MLHIGLSYILRNWSLEGFNAYVLCPHMATGWYNPGEGQWKSALGKKNLTALLDKIIAEYNIDEDNIIVAGASMGGGSAMWLAYVMPDYFSKLLVLSGYDYGVDLSKIEMPTRGYVGNPSSGEDSRSAEFMNGTFATAFGSQNTINMKSSSHNSLPRDVFNLDSDGNGRSDVVEWMFGYNVSSGISSSMSQDIVSPMTGLDTITGLMLEPTVEFFSFIIDALMSIFTMVMTQNEFEFVMVDKEKLPELGEATAQHVIEDMTPYENALGNIDIQYPNFQYSAEEIFSGKLELLDINFIDNSNEDEDWKKIRSVVSQWYQVLRMVAIIGLLSVLIYTGIKIIISSNAKDKAKYKEMIINWFVAVILAFSMHYIMAFILAIIEGVMGLLQGITGVIEVNAAGDIFKTNLIGLARFQIQQQHFSAKIGNLVIYTALVVYTFKFTFVYLKRVLSMAFLTMISPIVALTYPIDKMNGDAKGFKMWLREFLFNVLLQPMHYILYYLLVSSSLTLAARNPIYGIAALMFMSQAEKLLKRIFGFGKASEGTVGGIAGAFATGAITSSLMKHVRDPLHPFGGGKGNGKGKNISGGNTGNLGDGGYGNSDDTPNNFIKDTNVENFLNMNITGNAPLNVGEGEESAGGAEGTGGVDGPDGANGTSQPTLGIGNYINNYREGLSKYFDPSYVNLSFDDGNESIKTLLRKMDQCQRDMLRSDITPEQKLQLKEKYFELQNILQNRIMYNESGFTKYGIPFQYTDGDNRSTSDLMNEVIRLRNAANAPGATDEVQEQNHKEARRLLKTIKKRMAENQYIQEQGGPKALLEKEGISVPTPKATPSEQEKQSRRFDKIKNAPIIKGTTHVVKTLAKPVWDSEKDVKYNGKRLVKNIVKGTAKVAVGTTVGIAAAAVQAGISITDGKYSLKEGAATFAAGAVGGSVLVDKIAGEEKNGKESLATTFKEAANEGQTEKLVKDYGEQWFNNDDVINSYNKEFPGKGKEMRKRAVKNYISRGITDFKEQKQALRFAEKLKSERGMNEDDADRLAIATLQYKQSLADTNDYTVLYDKGKREKYIDTKADIYTGSAPKDSIKKLHNDFIQNVLDFDRANRDEV